jgi:hypothetical protein
VDTAANHLDNLPATQPALATLHGTSDLNSTGPVIVSHLVVGLFDCLVSSAIHLGQMKPASARHGDIIVPYIYFKGNGQAP